MSISREDLTKAFRTFTMCDWLNSIATEEVRIEVEWSFCVVMLAITLVDSEQLHSIKIVRQGLTAGGYSM